MSTGKEQPRRNCPSPDSCGWSKKDMLHFHCPQEDCKYSAEKWKTISAHIQSKHTEINSMPSTLECSLRQPDGEEGKSLNAIDDQKASAATTVKKKKKKKKNKRTEKADGNDERINQAVATEEDLKVTLPEEKPLPHSATKDDEEALLIPFSGDSDIDQNTSTSKSEKKNISPEKADSNDERINRTVSGLDVASEEGLKIPLPERKPSLSNVTKDDEAPHRGSDADEFSDNKDQVAWTLSDRVEDWNPEQSIFAEDEASSTGHETDWFDSSSSHVNWFFDNESGGSDEDGLTNNKDQVAWTLCDRVEDWNPEQSIFAEDEASYSDYEIDWFDPGSSHFALSSDHESHEMAFNEHPMLSLDQGMDTSFEFLVILDELLLDIFKESGEQFMDVQHLEKEVLDRTGCDFNTLHDIVKETELGSLGVEDFILNESKFFELEDSMVCPNFHFSPHKPGEGIDLDLSRCHISSCREFVDTCLMARNARSIVLANCTIGNETWPFGVLDLLLWFCPLLEEVDLTGCKCLRRSNFNKSPRHCRVIDYLNPSYILNSNNAVEKIRSMLSRDHLSVSLHSNGWTLLHSAVLLGSQELVKSCFAHYEFIGDNIYLESVHFQTSLELAIALHRCDILELFKEKIHHFDNTTPRLFLELCFLPQHGIRAFDHPVEILTSNKDTLRITRNLHAIQDCSLTRLLQIYLWEPDIDFKKEILETLIRHLEEFTGPDSHPAIPCWNDREVCEAVKILFKETGCSVNGKVEGFPYLMLSMPNVQLVEFFIQEGVQVDGKDQQGHTCLFHAVEKATGSDSPESWYMFINFLLQNKANPNERDNLSETPLLYSLSFGRSLCYFNSSGWSDVPYQAYGDDSGTRVVKIWRLLLEAKARPNVKDEKDRSLLHVFLSLLQTGCLRSSEGLEIVCNGIAILQEYGLEINSRDAKGNTALHLWAILMRAAISDETIKIGSEIVSHGGDVNSRNDKGDTPFHLLMKEPFLRDDLVEPDLWSRILALGMNPWIANCDGKCPFEVLLENKHFGSAFTLLKAIFEDDQNRDKAESARRYRNQSGDYLLHILCIVNNESVLEICDYLLGHGCEVNAQNECRQTPLHLLCNKVSETDSSLSQQTINFIRLLERHNADMTLSDIYGNTCKDILSKFQNFKTRKEMKWISESIAHEAKLSDVVLGKNSQQVENYHYHTESIGEGTFSCVFPAIDERDGREVALKRLEKARLANKGNMLEREVKCLLKSSSCPSVVNYIACTRDSNFEYIVVELMEDSLDNYLSSTEECSQASTICVQIALGMEFLHQNNVLHRDLKPQNILYRTKPHFIVKISDFGLSKFLQQTSDGSKSVMHSKAGTRCWMAPELLAQNHEGHSKATDIFSCGLLFHYVMSRKKHPFSHSRKSLKSNLHEIEENIQRDKKHLCSSLSSEASHLITKMLSKVPERRPAASSLLNFPFFWDDRKKVSFLNSVGNQKEFEVPRSLRLSCDLSKVERDLEKCFSGHFCATADWANQIRDVYGWARRNYNTTSGVELVRFIRNSHFHAYDYPEKIRKDLLEKFVVLKRFPYLVTDLYEVIKHHSSWTNREDLMHFFKN